MTSNDNAVDMTRLELLLREHFARTDKQLSDMRAENAEFRASMVKEFRDFAEKQDTKFEAFKSEIKQEMQDFKAEIKQDIQSFKAETNTRFDRLETQTAVIQNDITGLKHDVSNLFTWNYWTLSIILALVAMPHIVAGVKSLIQALSEGISLIVGAFKGNKREN